ncbi:hypothetical protein QVD17_40539 [Tagetes erecta]|uniref:RING-CH-type domain-containing protein n=1 Tax=Tagetes erecta TaxID=13708 RepID=A0AAD8JS12_TARER|nr:hypothetical protein QVD17_40539 [Tagetes erecta]
MMQTSHEITNAVAVADDDANNASSKVDNSVNGSINEVKSPEKNRRPSDLSIPKKRVHFGTPGSSSKGGTSPWGFFKSLSFKKKNVPGHDETSSLLHPAAQPESPTVTKLKSMFTWNRSTSLPVKHESNVSPLIPSPVSARTYSEQQKSKKKAEKCSVSRSHSTPLRNIVIVRSVSFAARKENDEIESADDQIRPAQVENDEEIDEEEAVCRICYVAFDEGTQLKMECSCKGALKLVHEECAFRWFTMKGNKNCDVCLTKVSNLPVTLFRMRSYVQRQNITAQTQRGLDPETISAWQDFVRLVLISTICYFLLIEQLLINNLKTQAVMIAAPFSLTFGLLSSTFAILATKKHIWRYAVLEFAFLGITLYLLYSLLHLEAVYAVMLSSVIGFGLALSLNALYIRYTVWRAQTS